MPSQALIHLFVYGTLTDPERVTALTGKQFDRVDATLSGFERVDSPLGYPFILPRPSDIVRGVLLLNIDPDSLLQLDAYEAEGDLYRRQVVEVEIADMRVAAMTYVGHGIRTSGERMTADWTGPPHYELLSEASTPLRRLRAPFAEEH
ncbi:MAG: gamma-glutamylcyclotransferase [Planctomycetaceae bacterium]|nr:MAG: gamma-glutamylcyclotransferase [Planctomycetaceae bacterium]